MNLIEIIPPYGLQIFLAFIALISFIFLVRKNFQKSIITWFLIVFGLFGWLFVAYFLMKVGNV